MPHELCLEPDTPIQVWDSLTEDWDNWSNWTYVSPDGAFDHYVRSDGITYSVPSSDIYELS